MSCLSNTKCGAVPTSFFNDWSSSAQPSTISKFADAREINNYTHMLELKFQDYNRLYFINDNGIPLSEDLGAPYCNLPLSEDEAYNFCLSQSKLNKVAYVCDDGGKVFIFYGNEF